MLHFNFSISRTFRITELPKSDMFLGLQPQLHFQIPHYKCCWHCCWPLLPWWDAVWNAEYSYNTWHVTRVTVAYAQFTNFPSPQKSCTCLGHQSMASAPRKSTGPKGHENIVGPSIPDRITNYYGILKSSWKLIPNVPNGSKGHKGLEGDIHESLKVNSLMANNYELL